MIEQSFPSSSQGWIWVLIEDKNFPIDNPVEVVLYSLDSDLKLSSPLDLTMRSSGGFSIQGCMCLSRGFLEACH